MTGAASDWMTPVSAQSPCGPDLEYDHDFVVLFASTVPKQEVQYGSFVGAADPINWAEVERDCRRLMSRTKDLRVAVLYTRCRTRLGGAKGFAEGTTLLAAWLQSYPDRIHPCAGETYERDEALEMRMNALHGLVDPEGLLADAREIVLAKSTAARLQVRDVERAFGYPRPADALAPDSVTQQLRALRIQQPATMQAFDEALANLAAIESWCAAHMEGYEPDLELLTKLLNPLRSPEVDTSALEMEPSETVELVEEIVDSAPAETEEEVVAVSDEGIAEDIDASATAAAPVVTYSTVINGRQAALATIRAARKWFESNEPSSPVPVLLRRAEYCVGKRYFEVVKAIPFELLAEWEAPDEEGAATS
ncbi:ImpA domain protein [Caballeronia insecticola]|uniref:ImpA domain protein n=1 Tax=Caballeronia insecticola TaxID=758793 RepID=R4WMJ5_9BURK|nr:ImpA domain protein [Caballeronia insecticola]